LQSGDALVWRRTGHAAQTLVVYPPTSSTATGREMSTTYAPYWRVVHFPFYLHAPRVVVKEPAFCCFISAVVLNHISSHFLIPLSDSFSFVQCPCKWLVILDTIIVITFNILIFRNMSLEVDNLTCLCMLSSDQMERLLQL